MLPAPLAVRIVNDVAYAHRIRACLICVSVSDIMVLCVEEHESKVETLKEIISNFSKRVIGQELTFYPVPLPGHNLLDNFECALENSQYTFVFLDDGSQEDAWMRLQQNAAVIQRIEEQRKYIVPVRSHSYTPIPWFLQMYHVLEISSLLKGKSIDQVKVNDLTENDINMALMNSLVTGIASKAEKLVTKIQFNVT